MIYCSEVSHGRNLEDMRKSFIVLLVILKMNNISFVSSNDLYESEQVKNRKKTLTCNGFYMYALGGVS